MSWARGLFRQVNEVGLAYFVCKEATIHPLIPMGTPCELRLFDKRTLKPKDVILCRYAGEHRILAVSSVLGERVELETGTGIKKKSIPTRNVYARLTPVDKPT